MCCTGGGQAGSACGDGGAEMNDENILKLLGLMRKAGSLCLGEDDSSEAVLSGKARLLLLPSDTGEKKLLRAERVLDGRSCVPVNLPFSEMELSAAVGTGSCSMAAVTDIGFAASFMKRLAESYPDRYTKENEEIDARLARISRRKKEKPGVKVLKK